jgi:hypothetical protein
MSRLVEVRIGEEAVQAPSTNEKIKQYGERVAKYVPAEVIAFYMGAVQIISASEGENNATLRLVAFAGAGLLAWIITPIWLGRFAEHPASRRPNQLMGFVAFLIWAYAYPAGFFAEIHWHHPMIAGLLLLVFTLLSGLYQPRLEGGKP